MSSLRLPDLKIGMIVEGYQLIKFLGNGSFGTVFQAESLKYGIVAFKAMMKERFSEHNGFLGQLVENERTALYLLKSEHIIKLYEYFETQQYAIFILEYCDGGTLEDYQKKHDCQIPQFQALNFFKQILKGMKALHKQRIIHRDLKLANILLHGSILKIADLGFCHLLKDQDNGLATGNLGSYGTMAPETLEGKPYGLQADMFSVGVILYLMIFSKYPFNSCNKQIFLKEVKENNPPKFKLESKVTADKNICDLLSSMLKYDPKERLKWSELFSNVIFMGQSSMSVMKDHTQYLADIDAHKSKQFYQNAEANQRQFEMPNAITVEQIQNEILKTNHKLQEIMKQSKQQSNKINQNIQVQQVNNIFNFEVFNQMPNYVDEHEMGIINSYIKDKQPISCLSITYNDMKSFQHKQIFDCIFVSYILIKQLYFQHNKLRISIKQNRLYPSLIKKGLFKKFMREFEDENEILSLYFIVEHQTVQANLKNLEKYLQPSWKCEVYSLKPTEQFQDIYRDVLQNYLKIIGMEELKSEPQLDRLQYIAMIINIKDYEELKEINEIQKGIDALKVMHINDLVQFIKSTIT